MGKDYQWAPQFGPTRELVLASSLGMIPRPESSG
jgi:hypothetical protein